MDHQCYTCKKCFKSEQAVESHANALGHYPLWDCDQCSDQYDNEDDLLDHKDTDHAYCADCGRQFSTLGALQQHYNDAPAHNHGCPRCSKVFKTEDLYKQHFSAEHPYSCLQCLSSFKENSLLQSHIKSVHSHPCTLCSELVVMGIDMELHIKKVHTYKCDYCVKTFHSSEARQKHKDLDHEFGCSKCTLPFKKEHHLMEHVRDKHPLVCFKCSKAFVNKLALDKHVKLYNLHCKERSEVLPIKDGHLDPYSSPQKSKCPECEKTYDSLVTFIEHYKWAHMNSLTRCPKCFKTCEDQTALLQHNVSTHMVKCGKCEALFSDDMALQRHSSMHSLMHSTNPSLKFVTETSSAPSLQSATRAKTKGISTQTTKYRCEQCNENFNDDAELERHEQHSPFHTAKVLECYECNLKFKTQIALLEHIDSKPHQARWVLVLI
jgi:uncharacterized C2H2 Zn-finger protein